MYSVLYNPHIYCAQLQLSADNLGMEILIN